VDNTKIAELFFARTGGGRQTAQAWCATKGAPRRNTKLEEIDEMIRIKMVKAWRDQSRP